MKLRQLNRFFLPLMLGTMVFLSGCDLFAEQIEINPEILKQASTQTISLLGDLNDKVSDSNREKLEGLVAEAISLCQKRENKQNYEMGKTEGKLWNKISGILDKETIRQFGKIEDDEDEYEESPDVDYVEEVLTRLKKTISKEDYAEIHQLMEVVNADDSSVEETIDAQDKMKLILRKYSQLDVSATIMNLLDEPAQNHIAVYRIQNDYSIIYEKGSKSGLNDLNIEKQKEMGSHWNEIKSILPESKLNQFKYFAVTSDGEWGTCAYVMRIDKTGENWCISIDPADKIDDGLFPYTIVHEYAHYLSLNNNQVEYYDSDVAYPMDTYWDYECIAKKDSYLQAYYEQFWEPIYMDWLSDSENEYFYSRHQSEFPTEYAATDCSEDFAESFAGYVLEEKAKSPQLKNKYDFFDQYPEFVELKNEILNNVKKNKIDLSPEIDPLYEEEAA
ncbi:hypothetical protein [Anaerovorax sp. IOR16]|uniref:hypothetical protein n=1 Tax=Anaerovorax sp. IOR16 TaxID=2773458 RepID=UPI0019D01B08|nr:hypothetical protein [Anaerovorax sp. IOR16]